MLRGSLFRSGYELLFVPMDPDERHRVKTMLDVTCDRAGEAVGAGIVQLLLLLAVSSITGSLLIVALLLAATAFWVGRRLDPLYVGILEQQLLRYHDAPPVSMVSEFGWTMIQPSADPRSLKPVAPPPAIPARAPAPQLDPHLEALADLSSGDVTRVRAALNRTATLERVHVAQIITLLAWDDVLPEARTVLEQLAPRHCGMLVDALLDPKTDFAIRRRVPRILGTCSNARSLDGVVNGLDDARFEVRYHCSRAVARMLAKSPSLSVDRARMIAVVERELSVPPQVWQGYRLLDRPELEDAGGERIAGRRLAASRTCLRAALDDRRPRAARRRRARHRLGEPRRARAGNRVPRSGAAAGRAHAAAHHDGGYTVLRRCSFAI